MPDILYDTALRTAFFGFCKKRELKIFTKWYPEFAREIWKAERVIYHFGNSYPFRNGKSILNDFEPSLMEDDELETKDSLGEVVLIKKIGKCTYAAVFKIDGYVMCFGRKKDLLKIWKDKLG
eukprot:UN28499